MKPKHPSTSNSEPGSHRPGPAKPGHSKLSPAEPGHAEPRPPAARIAPARAAAFHILSKVALSAAHSDDLLHTLAVNALSPEDRNLTTALVLGVLRWQLHLDTVLRPMFEKPGSELPIGALLSLRLGLFQLLYMDRIPAHAVLNDSVELARANGAPHAAGLVNAVLRRAIREQADPAKPRNTLATAVTPAEAAHPEWLLARWRANFGVADARRIAQYDQTEPASDKLFAAELGFPEVDEGSRLVAELAAAAVEHPARILDCCAAPGGKTIVLALRHPDAEIVAVDTSEKRLNAMRRRLDRSEFTRHVQTVLSDMTRPQSSEELRRGFDLILCDAPCSGTGTLARNPEIRHRLRGSDLPRQAQRQGEIVATALSMLAPGGRLVYSTCSLEPEENEAVVEAALASTSNVRLVEVAPILEEIGSLLPAGRAIAEAAGVSGALRTLPGIQPCDGFYAAVLERIS